jgi:hypothetical protein
MCAPVFFCSQCCDIAEVVIIHKPILSNSAINKNLKEKFKHPFFFPGYLSHQWKYSDFKRHFKFYSQNLEFFFQTLIEFMRSNFTTV